MRSLFLALTWQIVGAVLGSLGLCYALHTMPTKPVLVGFTTAHEMREFAGSLGLISHSGSLKNTEYSINFFIADHPITFDDLQAVCTRDKCGQTSGWRGILWVSQIHKRDAALCPKLIDGNSRIWGNLLVAGDENLMDRIEKQFRIRRQVP